MSSIEIVYEPYKKIIVHEIIEFSFEDLISEVLMQTRALGGTSIPTINWCEGIAFIATPFPPTEDIVREMLAGNIHYAGVIFARKDSFEPEIRGSFGVIRLVNRCNNPNYKKLAEYLKSFSRRI
ncbi:hypothetical protein SJAV_00840 [Sulfurisphaera javensis]|uniref:Uncharacterized protein n=1 Tax=Sulfurisphaera javensis TaxID=2049879 RepID=A0AAT9GN87_9CREN